MYSLSIESPIESLMVSPAIQSSPGSRVRDRPYWGYLYPPKTNYIYPGPHDLVQQSLSRLELVHLNSEGSGELPNHYLLPEIFKNKMCETFRKAITQLFDCVDLVYLHISLEEFLTEPNCLDCVIFASGCEMWRQNFRQHKSTQIVFVYGDIHGNFSNRKSDRLCHWTNHVHYRK